MSYQVETIAHFEKEAKRLKKRFPSLKKEIDALIDGLEENPTFGTSIENGFYKVRLAIRSKGKGKRGGARVITFVKIVGEVVYLVSVYDKSVGAERHFGESVGIAIDGDSWRVMKMNDGQFDCLSCIAFYLHKNILKQTANSQFLTFPPVSGISFLILSLLNRRR